MSGSLKKKKKKKKKPPFWVFRSDNIVDKTYRNVDKKHQSLRRDDILSRLECYAGLKYLQGLYRNRDGRWSETTTSVRMIRSRRNVNQRRRQVRRHFEHPMTHPLDPSSLKTVSSNVSLASQVKTIFFCSFSFFFFSSTSGMSLRVFHLSPDTL